MIKFVKLCDKLSLFVMSCNKIWYNKSMVDMRHDVAPVFQDESFEKDDLVYSVEWNDYMLSHEANIFEKVTNARGKVDYKQLAYGVGNSKDNALADATKKLDT